MAPSRDPFGFKAIIFGFLGFFVLVVLLNLMNGEVKFKKDRKTSQVKFEPKKIKPKTVDKIKKKEPKKRKRDVTKSLKPKMDMQFMAGGLDLGIDILGLSASGSQLLSQQGDSVMTEETVDRLPEVQYREAIPYPEHAKEQNIKGHVTLNILVDSDGRVSRVKLLDSVPEGIFDQVAMQAVRGWSFSPAEYQGKMVSVWVKQKLKFQVN